MKTESSSIRKDKRWCGHAWRGKVAAMAGCCQLRLFLTQALLSDLTSATQDNREKELSTEAMSVGRDELRPNSYCC